MTRSVAASAILLVLLSAVTFGAGPQIRLTLTKCEKIPGIKQRPER